MAELKDKFNPAFVERRKLALERFLARLLLHPYLGDHPFTKAFLSQQILLLKHINASSSSIIGTSTAGISSLMEQVSEAVSGLFGKPGPVEERFLKMKEICRVLDVHSTKLEDIFLNLYKAQKSIEEGLGSSRLNYVKLNSMPLMPHGTSEPANSNGKNLRTLLTKVLLITEERAESIRNFAVSLKNEVITPLHEYHKYSVNAKVILAGF